LGLVAPRSEVQSLSLMSNEERQEAWDDVFAKEEGIIIEFDMNTNTGRWASQRTPAHGHIFFTPLLTVFTKGRQRAVRLPVGKTKGLRHGAEVMMIWHAKKMCLVYWAIYLCLSSYSGFDIYFYMSDTT
jgi:hypothetical protein